MKIDLATIQDVPALLDLQRKAFGPLCEELDWKDAPCLDRIIGTCLRGIRTMYDIESAKRRRAYHRFQDLHTNSIYVKGSNLTRARRSDQD